jgi:hypothetical protein
VKKIKEQVIKFHAIDKHVMEVRPKPEPASSFMPEWWKNMQPYVNKKYDVAPASTVTAKKCFPLLDSMMAGYIVPLWADMYVTQQAGVPLIKWATHRDVLEAWATQQSKGFDVPEGFTEPAFKYLHDWIIETPKGWSCLITHPIGYQNLPFRTITGVVDTDKLKTQINTPFFIKEGFEGIIEQGTPMFQIIPIKRTTWKAEYSIKEEKQVYYDHEKLMSRLVSSYGRHLRELKKYY